MKTPSAADLLTERDVSITITVNFKTIEREVTHENALAYLRQAFLEQSDAELHGGITEVSSIGSLIHQDDVDNADYMPCIRCQGLFVCECSDEEVAAHIARLASSAGRYAALEAAVARFATEPA